MHVITRLKTLPEDCLDKLLERILALMNEESGQVRHYSVKCLVELGDNRKEVILKLIGCLGDTVTAVREEVKAALEQLAGKELF